VTGRRGRPPKAVLYQGDSRRMSGIESGSVDLVVTSPPYWQIKDYGCPGQIGAGEGLHEYLRSLARVWQECFRALRPGRYRVIPLHAEVVCQACAIGFDFMGSIIWQKKPGPPKKVARTVRDASAMMKEEWKHFFSGHWSIWGARRRGHDCAIGYEINPAYIEPAAFSVGAPVERAWSPRVPDLKPVEQPAGRDGAREAPRSCTRWFPCTPTAPSSSTRVSG